jgi:uncharacterized protein (DUF488 family)
MVPLKPIKNMSEAASPLKLVTIGVYGFAEADFFAALQRAGVDTFCDIRWRRGVRGAQYAFANSKRLQKRLGEMGIRYLHFRELAPKPALRWQQAKADSREGTTKRKRTSLGEEFIAGYCSECLTSFDSTNFVQRLGTAAGTLALFCVEREPAACHRSLLAARLQKDLGCEIVDLMPG